MIPLIYAFWIGIPLGFLFFGIALWLLQLIQGSADDESAASRAFHAAKLAALSGLIAFVLDVAVLRDEYRFDPQSALVFLLRLGLFPALLAAGYMISFMRRELSVREDRFRMQAPGSGGLLFLVIAAVTIAVIVYRPKNGIQLQASGKTAEAESSGRFELIDGWLQGFANSIHKKDAGKRSFQAPLPPQPSQEEPPAFVRPDFKVGGADLFPPMIQEAAREAGIDPALAQAIAEVASGYDNNLVSPAGRFGLMQLSETLLREYGAVDPLAPRQNIRAAVNYLKVLSEKSGSIESVIAAYRDGTKELSTAGLSPETRAFVGAVMEVYGILKANEAGNTDQGNTGQ